MSERCQTCGGIGLVAVVDRELVIGCPACDHDRYLEDCDDFGISETAKTYKKESR